jgi:hypothetical protein
MSTLPMPSNPLLKKDTSGKPGFMGSVWDKISGMFSGIGSGLGEMSPLAMAGVASAIPAAINTGFGIYQAYQGNKMLQGLKDPMMSVPAGALGAQNVAKNLAMQSMLPGQNLMEGRIDNSVSNTIGDAKKVSDNPNDALDAVFKSYGMGMEKKNDLGIAEANFQANNQMNLQGQENVMAQWQDKVWQNNEMNPFLRKAQTASALLGSGIQNISGGLNKASDIGANYFTGKYYGSLLDKQPK